MSKKNDCLANTRRTEQNIKTGKSLSERDQLLNTFARQADLLLTDAQRILSGDTAGIKDEKLADFNEAVSADYGDLDTFQIVYETLDSSEPG